MKTTFPVFDKRGFTLVEVLIALLVVGLLFVPVSNAFLQSVKVNQHLQQRVSAVRDTQEAMEVTFSVMAKLEALDNDQDREEEAHREEITLQLEEEITLMVSSFNSSGIIQPDTTVEIAPLHEDSPFFTITATSPDTSTKTGAAGSVNSFTLITLLIPGEAPWLTPKEYRVVTP